jgi:hypothetical protein
VIVVLAIVFGLLGLVLAVLAARLRRTGIQELFLIVTGASAAGMPIFFVLQNLHDLFTVAFLVCAPLFLIGTWCSIVLFVEERIAKRTNVP